VNAAQGGAHVTFTQDTWEHIYKTKDRDYPDERIVGWYHSHPGFGVFLSDHDTFIHKNFFSSPQQVAWVYDPHSDEEGCFAWRGDRIERLANFAFVDERGGEVAGGADKPRSHAGIAEDDDEFPRKEASRRDGARKDRFAEGNHDADNDGDNDLSRLANTVSLVFSHLLIFVLGGILVWYFLPRFVGIPVDPRTGRPLMDFPDATSGAPPSRGLAPGDVAQPPANSAAPTKPEDSKPADSKSGEKTRDDGHQ
jgi:hypothetical protein